MPTYYQNDSDYTNEDEENQDKRDATQAKLETIKKEKIMDFDEFIIKERIGDAIYSKNHK